MKNKLILSLLLLLVGIFFNEVSAQSNSPESPIVKPIPGELSLLAKHIPARNEIKQIPGTKFLGMLDLDGDGWRNDSPTSEHVLVTTRSFPQCLEPYDMYCHTTWDQFDAWVGGAYSSSEYKLRVLAGGGHGDGGSNAVYSLDLKTLTPSRETDPSALDGPLMIDEDGDGVKESCPYPSNGPPASHTYDGVVDLGDKVFVTGWVGFCANAMSSAVGFWLYDKREKSWEQIAKYSESARATRSGYDPARNVIYFMDNKDFREFDLKTRKTKFLARPPEGYSDGRGTGHFDPKERVFYFTEDDLWGIYVPLNGRAGPIQKISSEFKGHFVQNTTTGVLWSWDCVTNIKSYDPSTGNVTQHSPGGVTPLNSKRRVYSKLFFIEELGVLACIDEPKHGLYIYNPPGGPIDGIAQVIPEVDSSVPDKVIYHESFESAEWYKSWLGRSTKTSTKAVDADDISKLVHQPDCLEGYCAKVKVTQYRCCGISIFYPISGERENVSLEYYLKLAPNWSPNLYNSEGYIGKAGGKLPGLADNREWPDKQCGNGGAQSDGVNCWTMRLKFDDCPGTGAQCGNKTRIGGYLYYPEANDYWGLFAAFDNERADISGGIGRAGQLENDRWYHIKMQVVMNSPGHKNGVIRGWVDGKLSFERDDFLFRFKNHDNLHVRNVWFNVYFGGQAVGPREDTYILVDELVIKAN